VEEVRSLGMTELKPHKKKRKGYHCVEDDSSATSDQKKRFNLVRTTEISESGSKKGKRG